MQSVKVRLRKPRRVFTFLSDDIALRRDDACVVKSDRGLEYGVCVLPPEDCSKETESRYKMNVLRKATYHDKTTFDRTVEDEARAKKTCAGMIARRKLAMKLVDVEYTFDRKKIIFYFTADERVDFRELVRDLAHDLKARIELRHIQVRDEAKMLGAIGTCGRELCCTTWLRDFAPISMKMAKRQNLSLNPAKISGQCGRLMCCLAYENDQYTREKKVRKVQEKKPEDLAAIRDKMEAQPTEAVETLSESALTDVVQEHERPPSESTGRQEAAPDTAPAAESRPEAAPQKSRPDRPPQREQQRPSQPPRGDRPAGEAGPSKPAEGTSGEEGTRKRRRRRRRRRPKGDGSSSGSGSGGSSSGSS